MTSLQLASLDEIREVAARICRDYLTGRWKVVTAEQLNVKRISGGLSNFLYYVSLPADNNCTDAVGAHNVPAVSIETLGGDGNANKRQRTDSGEVGMTSSRCMQNKQQEPQEVLLRIYGQTHGEDALEAMITESVVFALLSERNFGPKLHGVFPGGRIEQFIPARPLLTIELSDPKISLKIAEKMGEIHSLNIPMSKEPDWLWNCMDRWLKTVTNILEQPSSPAKDTNAKHIEIVRSFNYSEETKWLKSVIDDGHYKVLFCHNDLQEGNILLRENETSAATVTATTETTTTTTVQQSAKHDDAGDEVIMEHTSDFNMADDVSTTKSFHSRQRPQENDNNATTFATELECTRDSAISNSSEGYDPDLIIIDFEYCAYNYRGFDLANHFLEWSFDYSNPEFPCYYHKKKQYPSKQQRLDFIMAYLKKLNEFNTGYTPSADEVESVEREVGIFSMFSHLFWSLWSAVNVTSNIEFGYWEYAVTRLQEYQALKHAYNVERSIG